MPNAYEVQARLKKAIAITNALQQNTFTCAEVEAFTDEHWGMAASAARQKMPSAETRKEVVSMLRAREQKR